MEPYASGHILTETAGGRSEYWICEKHSVFKSLSMACLPKLCVAWLQHDKLFDRFVVVQPQIVVLVHHKSFCLAALLACDFAHFCLAILLGHHFDVGRNTWPQYKCATFANGAFYVRFPGSKIKLLINTRSGDETMKIRLQSQHTFLRYWFAHIAIVGGENAIFGSHFGGRLIQEIHPFECIFALAEFIIRFRFEWHSVGGVFWSPQKNTQSQRKRRTTRSADYVFWTNVLAQTECLRR